MVSASGKIISLLKSGLIIINVKPNSYHSNRFPNVSNLEYKAAIKIYQL